MLKVGKWFTVFKTVNHFSGKLNKNFRSKGKYFQLIIILRHGKHHKIRKSFYVEVNGALINHNFIYLTSLSM
jgi:hypothetical protein